MTDASHTSFRTFDPAQEEGANPPQRSVLRDRLRQAGAVPAGPEATSAPPPVEPAPAAAPTPVSFAPSEGLRPLSDQELVERAPPRPEPAVVAEPEPISRAAPEPDVASENATQPIGVVLEIAGSGSQIAIDLERLNQCMEDADGDTPCLFNVLAYLAISLLFQRVTRSPDPPKLLALSLTAASRHLAARRRRQRAGRTLARRTA